MPKTVLMVAFHFPPAAMGSGHLRTLGFARYLPEFDWNPVVLSARAMAYPRTAPLAPGMIPENCRVQRVMAFDARRHFGVSGKYPGFLARPDRWSSWWPAAVLQGLRLIRRRRVDAIWSTYPIMSAHCIARSLSRISGLPWIADFRDPVSGSVDTANRGAAASQRRWEGRVIERAARVVFTTPGAMREYAERFPEAHAAGRLAVIGNGYDERAFADLSATATREPGRPLTLVHSGLLYPDGRNPVPFFKALARLRDAGDINADTLRVVLRASGSESAYARELQRLGLARLVELAPPVSNRDALAEQAAADGLLLFQGSRFDRQIPAKVYEYLRIARPIFALAGAAGDTAQVLGEAGGAVLVAPDDTDAIAAGLAVFIADLRAGHASAPRPEVVAGYSRKQGAQDLARLLQQVSG